MRTKNIIVTASLVGLIMGGAVVGCVGAANPSIDAPVAPVSASTAAPEESVSTPERSEPLNTATPTPTPTEAPDITVAPCTMTDIPAYTRTDECVNDDGTIVPTTPTSTPPAAPEPVKTTRPDTDNPPLNCPAWTSPGWLDANGQPSSCLWNMPNAGGTLSLKACHVEDEVNCFWDATKMGNHIGRSFININGHVFYDYDEESH